MWFFQRQKPNSTELLDQEIKQGIRLYDSGKFVEAYQQFKKCDAIISDESVTAVSTEIYTQLYTYLGNTAYALKLYATARKYYKSLLHYRTMEAKAQSDITGYRTPAQNAQISLVVQNSLGSAYYKLATANRYIDDWQSIEKAVETYKSLYEKTGDRQIRMLYQKISDFRQERIARTKHAQNELRTIGRRIMAKADELGAKGVVYPDAQGEVSLRLRIESDVMLMALGLLDHEGQITPQLVNILCEGLDTRVSVESLKRNMMMKSMLGQFSNNLNQGMLGEIPQSVAFLWELQQMSAPMQDYTDSYAFDIRFLMYTIGGKMIDMLGLGDEKRTQLTEYMDMIDLWLESAL